VGAAAADAEMAAEISAGPIEARRRAPELCGWRRLVRRHRQIGTAHRRTDQRDLKLTARHAAGDSRELTQRRHHDRRRPQINETLR